MVIETENPAGGAIPSRASNLQTNSRKQSDSTDRGAVSIAPELNEWCEKYLPDRLRSGHDLRAVIAASNFHVTPVMVLNGAGEPLLGDCSVVNAFTAPWSDSDPPPKAPDDWPLIELSAPAVVGAVKGKRPNGRETPRPKRIRSFFRLTHVRAGVVLEIAESAVEIMRKEFRLRPLPPGVPWTRNRAGAWQGWFMWPPEMALDGDNELPPGVRLLDRTVEAPLDAKNVPERLAAFRLPLLPKWLAISAGGRNAETTEECLLGAPLAYAPFEFVGEEIRNDND